MKKLTIATSFLFLMFSMGAMAQSTDQSTNSRPDTRAASPGAIQNTTNPNSSDMGSQSTMNSQQSSMGTSQDQYGATSTSSQNGANSLEGCVVKVERDYYIEPVNGQRVKLSGNQDFSQEVGHNVRVEGRQEAASNSSSSPYGGQSSDTSSMGTQSAQSSTGNSGWSQNPQSSSTSQTDQQNQMGQQSQMGQKNNSGMNSSSNQASTGNNGQGTQSFLVDRITTVSQTCPTNTNSTGSSTQSPQMR